MARPLSLQTGDLADAAVSRLEEWERILVNLAAGAPPFAEEGFVGQELKAASVVAAMAELECFLREYLGGLSDEVNSASIQLRNLRASLRPLAGHADFISLMVSNDSENIFRRRHELTTMETSERYVSFPSRHRRRPQPPLDGRTITGEHVVRVWGLLGVPGEPFPRPGTAAALKKLASLRNDVAHRNLSLSDLFKQPGTAASDVLAYMSELKYLLEHMRDRLRSYAADRGYLIV